MWESVERLISSGKGWFVLIIIGLIVVAVRMGYMKVKTDKIMIGKTSSEKTRLLMKKQSEFAHTSCTAFEKRIPRFDGYNEYLGKYVVEMCFDEIVDWIMINHMEDSPDYIETKQEKIWNIVTNSTVDARMRTDKFKKQVDSFISDLIKRLVTMRDNNL